MSRSSKDQVLDLTGTDDSFDMGTIAKVLIEKLPVKVQRRVHALKNIHSQYIAYEKQYNDEVKALDVKYQKLYEPLYLKRASIANGEYEPTDDESKPKAGEQLPEPKPGEDKENIKGIPNFWLTALRNNVYVSEMITENDDNALSSLRDIRASLLDGQEGFQLTFHFGENAYFTDTVLTKTYFYSVENEDLSGELVWDHAEGCKINWKSGKNLTVKLTKKKQGGGGKGWTW